MNNKGMTGVELLAIIVIIGIALMIMASFIAKDPTPELEMQWCMEEYEDFEYCKYRLGVEDEFRQSN